ncbi:tRNA (32-2'-O)-methyltransferase regulator THADA-like isoform X1 [Pantherophis guttatus]|uniref:tRNA (32-2'-O)-methyltransferase regulator THADA-like isoform X1 n=3 Tax=Pantherophis guttatus TaxID=94885 RepID=A0ABM3YUE7_PANGU|nr:tRNA (32-2'-O)-methyltransferase regulator THADA-like isoform X1 [Pantherophis guttatus]
MQELERCTAFYQTLEGTDQLRETSSHILLLLQSLQQFAKGSVKRCKEKNLEEASQLLARLSRRGLGELDREAMLPLVRCVLRCQMETTTSSSLFCRLEKIVGKLSEQNITLVSEELRRLMDGLIENDKPASSEVLQTVSLFIEESSLGHQYWKKNLIRLLKTIAATFEVLLRDSNSSQVEWHYVTIKVCLHLFKGMSEEIQPLVWDETDHREMLQKILRSLVHTIMDQTACKDNRLLAGTTVSMMVNTAPEVEAGAKAIWAFYLLMNWNAQRTEERKEGCQFGALWIPASTLNPGSLEKLVMTRGLLTCCKKEILSCLLDGGTPQKCLLLDVLFPAVLDVIEEPTSCSYYSFQVFSLWLQRVRESLKDLWKVKESSLLGDNSGLLQRLNKIVWNNAESPTEGVSDFVHSSFRILLEIYSLECDCFGDPERSLFREYLQRVIFMPWEARARYFALSAILPYLGPQKVLEIYADLPQHLFNCLSTNRLCPIASDLYKTLLRLQRKAWTEVEDEVSEEQLAHKWSSCWLPTLSSALTSSDPFLQSNASSHVLGWTLRVFPASYALLATRFGGREASHLRAWVSLLNVQKTLAGDLLTDEETLKRLTWCLFSKEEIVRLAALGFLCSAPKTSQVLSEREIQLLKEFLPLNLSCDSSSFRQLLQAMVKKALVRIRDSSLAVLRQQKANQKESLVRKDQERKVLQAVEFVDWLLKLCTTSLMSGSNYQRRKTALLLLAAILETFTDTWRPERKKGQPPRNMATLLCWSTDKGYWDIFSTGNTLALLSCLQDSTNEIRELASELLISYFPPDLPGSAAVALFGWALEAVSSPRVQESEAGAAVMKTLLPKLDRHILERSLLGTEKEPTMPCKYLSFLEHLLNMLRNHFVTASRDLLLAAHTTPIHGVILALRRCLLEEPEVVSSMLEAQKMPHWRLFFQRLVIAVRDVSDLLLSVLQSHQASSTDQHASSPSFADMGNAIGSLIRLGKGLEEEEEEDMVLLSEEHSLILTCCWVSVKEIGMLLGGLAEKVLPRPLSAGWEPLLPLQVVHMASKVFQDILLKCRHWGAVEGCSVGFTKFCTTLLSHPSPELQNIPRTMLTQGLALLNSPRGSSVTRRAAGFPMLFLCITTGEDPAKSRPLLTHCLQTLLALANQPIPHSSDQTLDLPQVSAVHVLQTLVRGSHLGPALQQHITPLMVLVLKALSSPSWAMRNAANQLFGALTVRLLGQKWSSEDGRAKDGVSPEALFARHVHLRSILLGELSLAVEVSISEGPRRGKFHLCPSLYAVLTFLAKLQPSRDTQDSTLTCFLEPLIQLSGNPIYAVRAMAAKALVPFIPVTDYGKIVLRLAARFPQPEAALSHNALHGCLLQIQAVLNQALKVDRLHPELLRSVACIMESHIWMLMDIRRCPLICAVYLQVLSILLGSCSPVFLQKVWDLLYEDLASPKPGFSPIQLGSSIFCQWAVNFLSQEATRQESPERIHDLNLLLERGNPDVQAAFLTWLLDIEERKSLKSNKELQLIFMGKFTEILKNPGDPAVLKLYLKVFLLLFGNVAQRQPFPEKLALECGEILFSMVESNHEGPGLRDHAFCAATLFLSQHPEGDRLWERWIATIEKWSNSLSDEVLRMAAAKAIQMGGPAWIWEVRKSSDFLLRSQVLRLIEAAIHLLQDEDQEVRHEAASFVSCLVQIPSPVQQDQPHHSCLQLQSSKALFSLLQFLLENFGDHPSTFASLMHLLPMVELSETLMELESQGVVSLYKEDEPNVYTEPAVFSQMLLPFLLQLVENASTSRKLWESIQSWLETTGAGIICTVEFCRQWWSQEDIPCLHLKALSCPHVHSAITALLVKAILVAHVLKILETQNQLNCTAGITISFQELSCTIHSLKDLLRQCGIAVTVEMEQQQAGLQETS